MILNKLTLGELLYFFCWFLVIYVLWKHLFYFDGRNYWVGWHDIWGDWSTHIPYILNFAYRSFPLPFHPQLWGEPFRYHYAADLISGLLMKSGLTIIQATVWPSIICMEGLIIVIYFFFLQIYRRRRVAVISSFLFLFNGGLGIFYFIYNYLLKATPLPPSPPLYLMTKDDSGSFLWMNFMLAEFIPQRAFLLGAPITIFILTAMWKILRSNIQSFSNIILVLMGLSAGLLPVIHYHSYFVVLLISLYVCLLSLKKNYRDIFKWIWFFIPYLVVSFYVLIFVLQGIGQSSIQWRFGSIGPTSPIASVFFWVKNLGIMAVLIPLAFLKSGRINQIFYLPFIFLFIISNLILFQHDPWDNRKFLLYWYLASAGSVGNYLHSLIQNRRYLLFGLLFYLAIISGFIDFANLFRFDKQKIIMFSEEDVKFGKLVRAKTDPEAVFLTAPSNTYFSMTAGRQIVMGWPNWLNNYGNITTNRINDINAIYLGSSTTLTSIKKYAIDFIVIGPRERFMYPINESYFANLGPIYLKNNRNAIYDVRKLRTTGTINQKIE